MRLYELNLFLTRALVAGEWHSKAKSINSGRAE
jgi:hypothetical protein